MAWRRFLQEALSCQRILWVGPWCREQSARQVWRPLPVRRALFPKWLFVVYSGLLLSLKWWTFLCSPSRTLHLMGTEQYFCKLTAFPVHLLTSFPFSQYKRTSHRRKQNASTPTTTFPKRTFPMASPTCDGNDCVSYSLIPVPTIRGKETRVPYSNAPHCQQNPANRFELIQFNESGSLHLSSKRQIVLTTAWLLNGKSVSRWMGAFQGIILQAVGSREFLMWDAYSETETPLTFYLSKRIFCPALQFAMLTRRTVSSLICQASISCNHQLVWSPTAAVQQLVIASISWAHITRWMTKYRK